MNHFHLIGSPSSGAAVALLALLLLPAPPVTAHTAAPAPAQAAGGPSTAADVACRVAIVGNGTLLTTRGLVVLDERARIADPNRYDPCTREALRGVSADQVRLPVASLQHFGEGPEWYVVRGRELRAVQPRGLVSQNDFLVGVHREGTITRGLSAVADRPYLPARELASALGGRERIKIEWLQRGGAFRVQERSDVNGAFDTFLRKAGGEQQEYLPVINIMTQQCGVLCCATGEHSGASAAEKGSSLQ